MIESQGNHGWKSNTKKIRKNEFTIRYKTSCKHLLIVDQRSEESLFENKNQVLENNDTTIPNKLSNAKIVLKTNGRNFIEENSQISNYKRMKRKQDISILFC
jgi:type II secretory pathway component PulC